MNLYRTLAHSVDAMKDDVVKSVSGHERAEMGCFGRVQCGKQRVTGCSSGGLMYANLFDEEDSNGS